MRLSICLCLLSVHKSWERRHVFQRTHHPPPHTYFTIQNQMMMKTTPNYLNFYLSHTQLNPKITSYYSYRQSPFSYNHKVTALSFTSQFLPSLGQNFQSKAKGKEKKKKKKENTQKSFYFWQTHVHPQTLVQIPSGHPPPTPHKRNLSLSLSLSLSYQQTDRSVA